MATEDKKLTRSHDRQKRRRKAGGQTERFYLQGARWRFPSEIGLAEVEVRIGRLRALWGEQEAFCQTGVLLNLEAASHLDGFVLDDAVAFVNAGAPQNRAAEAEPGDESSRGPSSRPSWLQRTIERQGIVKAAREGAWSPLTLWITEQIRLGVQPGRASHEAV
jgi:hypothetical protein